jgi:hypothetical protein
MIHDSFDFQAKEERVPDDEKGRKVIKHAMRDDASDNPVDRGT